jgi:hypothetical protein
MNTEQEISVKSQRKSGIRFIEILINVGIIH